MINVLPLRSQTVIATFNPLKMGTGLIVNTGRYRVNPLLSYETGRYDDIKLVKYGAGLAILNKTLEDDYMLNIVPCYNITDAKVYKISIEIGVTMHLDKVAIMIMSDLLNQEGKVGIGFKLGKL